MSLMGCKVRSSAFNLKLCIPIKIFKKICKPINCLRLVMKLLKGRGSLLWDSCSHYFSEFFVVLLFLFCLYFSV